MGVRLRARLASAVLILFAAPAAAQHWETPTFFSPRPADDIGVYITNADVFDEIGLMAIWRQTGNINLGVRAGLANLGPDDRGVLVGAEFMGPLNIGAGSGLLVAWMVGAGAVFNDVTLLRVPAGASIGLDLSRGTGLSLMPYAHPRLAFDLLAIGEGEDEETVTEFNFELDLGAEIGLGERFLLRAAYTIGEFDTFGAGIAYRIPRPISVR